MSSKLKLCNDGSDLVWLWYKVKTRIWQIRTGRKVIEWTLNVILRKEKQFHLQPLTEYNKRGYSNLSMSSCVKGNSLYQHRLVKMHKCDRILRKLKSETFFFLVFLSGQKLFLPLKLPLSINIKINWRYKSVTISIKKTSFSTRTSCRSYAPHVMLAFWQKLLAWSCGFHLESW